MPNALFAGFTKVTAISLNQTALGAAQVLFKDLKNGVPAGAAPGPITLAVDSELEITIESIGPAAAALEWYGWPVEKRTPPPVLPLGTLFPFDATDATGQPTAATLSYLPPADGTWNGASKIVLTFDSSGILRWEERGVSSTLSLRPLANANPVGLHIALRLPATSKGAIKVVHRQGKTEKHNVAINVS